MSKLRMVPPGTTPEVYWMVREKTDLFLRQRVNGMTD